MQNKRGSIFKPFAALKGFDEAIKEKEDVKCEKPILSSDKLEELEESLSAITETDLLLLKYYRNQHIYTINCYIKKIDYVYKKITAYDIESDKQLIIDVNNILDIKISRD